MRFAYDGRESPLRSKFAECRLKVESFQSDELIIGPPAESGLSDPVVKLQISPPLSLFEADGAQSQRTSRCVGTLNPHWVPAESFRFIVDETFRTLKILM